VISVKKFSIKFKILSIVIFSIVLLMMTGAVGYYSLNRSIEEVRLLTQDQYPKILVIQRLKADSHSLMRFLWSVHGLYAFPAERKNQINDADKAFQEFDRDFETLKKYPHDKVSLKAINEIDKRWKDLKAVIPKILNTYRLGTDDANKEASMTLAIEAVPQSNDIYEFLNEVDSKFQNDILNETKNNELEAQRLKMILVSSVILAFITLLIFGFLLANNLSKMLLFIAQNIRRNSDHLKEAAKEVSGATKTLVDDSTRQSTAMDETSSSVEELNQMIYMNSENANKSVDISDNNRKQVEESQHILEKVIQAINEVDHGNQKVAHQVEANNEKLNEIVKIILEINSKTTVINDIVFQIKLLSFNASVEAARAGEHGKGFAVVAEEVGNLAQSTAKAAQEISDLLNVSVSQVKNIAKETAEQIEHLVSNNKENVFTCVNLSNECSTYLRKVVHGSGDVNKMVREISASSSEQSIGMGEISRAMGQLSDIFQTSQKLASESEHTVQLLYKQVEELNSEVRVLNEIVNGRA